LHGTNRSREKREINRREFIIRPNDRRASVGKLTLRPISV